jgi:hypothetical protein
MRKWVNLLEMLEVIVCYEINFILQISEDIQGSYLMLMYANEQFNYFTFPFMALYLIDILRFSYKYDFLQELFLILLYFE